MVDEARAAPAIDAVVAFSVPLRGAIDRIRIHLERQRWAPPELRRLHVHGHGLRGVLVPFWVYDAVVRSEYRARIGVDWVESKRVRGPDGKSRTERVQHTEWSRIRGTAARQIVDHVVSASVGLPAHEANPLEPFDLGRATAFDPRLLSGFEAELASVTTDDAEQLAIAQLREAEGPRIVHDLLPGDHNRLDAITSEVAIHGRRLVLLPVWIASYRHHDTVLRLLVNGQTGEVVGRVPVSRTKIGVAVGLGLALVVFVALLGAWLGWWS
jgi:hypothetical protein